jgi:hypothetical protein
MSCLEENLTLTVSDGSSSVYKRLPDPLGFLPVPVLGSASFNSCLVNISQIAFLSTSLGKYF